MINDDMENTKIINIKNKKINEQEALILKYNKIIKDMEEERKKTIVAHQNRIKQLQDKYLNEQNTITGNYKKENEILLKDNEKKMKK